MARHREREGRRRREAPKGGAGAAGHPCAGNSGSALSPPRELALPPPQPRRPDPTRSRKQRMASLDPSVARKSCRGNDGGEQGAERRDARRGAAVRGVSARGRPLRALRGGSPFVRAGGSVVRGAAPSTHSGLWPLLTAGPARRPRLRGGR